MPSSHVVNPHDTLTPERSVHCVEVGVGTAVITKGDETEVVKAVDSYEADGAANLSIYSPDGARVTIVFADEPQTATVEPRAARAGSLTSPRTTGTHHKKPAKKAPKKPANGRRKKS